MNLKLYSVIIIPLLLTTCTPCLHDRLYEEKLGFYAYIIGDIKSDYIDTEHASEVYATPASCQKVITTLVALKTLGPEYRYKTKLFTKEKGSTIHDIVIAFSGDPTLTSEKLISLLKPLENIKIYGKIILDASIFKTPPYSTNLVIHDIGTRYSTPVSSINIDKNLIMLKVLPREVGESAEIYTDDYDIHYIKSDVITDESASSIKYLWNGDAVNVTGNINKYDSPIELKISPQESDNYIKNKVRTVLNTLNIKGEIKIVHDKNDIATDIRLINEIESSYLKDIIIPALKISNNLVFDSIYLTIIHYNSAMKISDWSEGDVVMKELINKHFAVDANNSLFVDGSGLSRYNRIQPKVLLSLLKKGFFIPEFVNALPKPGEEESTLKNRTTLPDHIIAKSGNMLGISCLCGYSLAPSYRQKAFVFIINSFAPPSKELFDIMDDFIKIRMLYTQC
jgi:serine-type D-Ala-D-Ala carboxypeptidase/endopeptidase (penicillin-binding protein 4)